MTNKQAFVIIRTKRTSLSEFWDIENNLAKTLLTIDKQYATLYSAMRKGEFRMDKFVIATTAEGCIFGNYYTEVMSRDEAESKLEQVRQADPNAKLLKVVIEGKEEM